MNSVGLTALSVAFPDTVRTNDHWKRLHPDMVSSAKKHALARLWAPQGQASTFERAMQPFAADPFKGAQQRYVSHSDTASVDLHTRSIASLMDAWSGTIEDLDFAIISSMRPDSIAVGDAAWLARRAGLRCPAINLETACASAVMGFDLACSMVETGRATKVLVSAACTYARDVEETSSLSWFLGDGAGAFVVERRSGAAVNLGAHSISTQQTCGAFVHEMVLEDGRPALRMRTTEGAGAILHDTAEPFVVDACSGALRKAGVDLADVALFVFNTPTAWYAHFCADVLGVDRERTVSVYSHTTNIGPALMAANLHHAASNGRLQPGDLVLVYAVGSTSTAMAAVVRWGDAVALSTSV